MIWFDLKWLVVSFHKINSGFGKGGSFLTLRARKVAHTQYKYKEMRRVKDPGLKYNQLHRAQCNWIKCNLTGEKQNVALLMVGWQLFFSCKYFESKCCTQFELSLSILCLCVLAIRKANGQHNYPGKAHAGDSSCITSAND